eukprot:5522490-Pleurochrysis_carterae.AAC.1
MKVARPRGRELYWQQPGGTHGSRPKSNAFAPLGRRGHKPTYPPPQEPSSSLSSSTDKSRCEPTARDEISIDAAGDTEDSRPFYAPLTKCILCQYTDIRQIGYFVRVALNETPLAK